MGLRKKQSEFACAVGKLIAHAYSLGYEITFGDAKAFNLWNIISFMETISQYIPDRLKRTYLGFISYLKKSAHSKKSFHYKKLAIDINLFKDDEYLISTEDHEPLGIYWKSLGGTWGGDFKRKDGNHYSWGE